MFDKVTTQTYRPNFTNHRRRRRHRIERTFPGVGTGGDCGPASGGSRRGNGMQFVVWHDGGLLGRLVAALVRDVYPQSGVRSASLSHVTCRGVRVEMEGTERWIFVTSEPDTRQSMARAISEGATAVLSLESPEDDFRAAMTALVEGGRSFVPRSLMQWMATEASADGVAVRGASSIRLTPREREVLSLVALGCTNTQIARRLQISANTVRTHLHSLGVKLEAPTRMKMVAAAQTLGLLLQPEVDAERQIPA